MKKTVIIGTRDSELALWQANKVKTQLESQGFSTELLPVKSEGDLVLDKPLYEFGITGIFTKTLDIAILTKKIDVAVHSMKDVPTILPQGIVEAAVLKRASSKDVLIHKGLDFLNDAGTIATGSLRRKAQWLHQYPNHRVVNLRGNINTRLRKLQEEDWDAAIFASAGLDRINLKPDSFLNLDWMVPAPAQGAMLVVAREEDYFCRNALATLNDKESEMCVHIERQFLRTLEGGCSAPIGALAEIEGDEIQFKGVLFSLDGKEKFEIEKTCSIQGRKDLGKKCAEEILKNGASELMTKLKAFLDD